MDSIKFRLVLWVIVLILAIAIFWVANENRITNNKIIEAVHVCEEYQDRDFEALDLICKTEPFKGLSDYKIGDYQPTFEDLNIV